MAEQIQEIELRGAATHGRPFFLCSRYQIDP